MSDSKHVSANLLVGKAMSWNLVAGPRAGLGLLGEGEGALVIQLGPGSGCLKVCVGLLEGRAGAHLILRAGSDLLVGRLGLQALGLQFFACSVCPLVAEAGPEARTGFLKGSIQAESRDSRVGTCPLEDGVRSWALWWVRPHPEAAMVSGNLKAASMLMGRAVSLPS